MHGERRPGQVAVSPVRPKKETMFDEPSVLNRSQASAAVPDAPAPSPGEVRFNSCRWHKAADERTAAHCTHRDVLPMAGTAGFNVDAWCTDCSYYKLRRTPKKPGYA
jgi:hypothetical protein